MLRLQPRIFLSYATENYTQVDLLYRDLELARLEPWMDRRTLQPGQAWDPVIAAQVRQSDFFLACLSPESLARPGAYDVELEHALALQRKSPHSLTIIPVRLADVPLPPALAPIHRADLFEPLGREKLIAGIRSAWRKRLARRAILLAAPLLAAALLLGWIFRPLPECAPADADFASASRLLQEARDGRPPAQKALAVQILVGDQEPPPGDSSDRPRDVTQSGTFLLDAKHLTARIPVGRPFRLLVEATHAGRLSIFTQEFRANQPPGPFRIQVQSMPVEPSQVEVIPPREQPAFVVTQRDTLATHERFTFVLDAPGAAAPPVTEAALYRWCDGQCDNLTRADGLVERATLTRFAGPQTIFTRPAWPLAIRIPVLYGVPDTLPGQQKN